MSRVKITELGKVCTRCGLDKPLTEYTREKRHVLGLNAVCKACIAMRARAYREADPERAAAQRKAYYEANREKVHAINAAWRKANPERFVGCCALRATWRSAMSTTIRIGSWPLPRTCYSTRMF